MDLGNGQQRGDPTKRDESFTSNQTRQSPSQDHALRGRARHRQRVLTDEDQADAERWSPTGRIDDGGHEDHLRRDEDVELNAAVGPVPPKTSSDREELSANE